MFEVVPSEVVLNARTSEGIILTVDMTNRESLEEAAALKAKIKQALMSQAVVVVAGTKCDEGNQCVTESELLILADELGGKHFVVSA
jgi:hypothetical protein